MPLLKEIDTGGGGRLALWEITENIADLKWQLQWGPEDIKRFGALADEQRSMHWLCSRVLLRKMLNTQKFIDLQVDEHGKPYLKNFPEKLSISHSGKRVAVLLSPKECGVDIQHIQPRIERIEHKFMAREELEFLSREHRMEQVHIFWSAKECLYKLYGKRKLDFRKNLYIYPFEWAEKGSINGRITKDRYIKDVLVNYRKMDDYILAYAIDK